MELCPILWHTDNHETTPKIMGKSHSFIRYRRVATCLLSGSKFTVAIISDFLFPSMLVSLTEKMQLLLINSSPVVRKPTNPNPRLKFNQVLHLAR